MNLLARHVIFRALLRWTAAVAFCIPLKHRPHARLRALGHDVEVLADYSEAMGHAGAIVRHPNGLFEGAADPRSNGSAAGY